MCKSPRIQRPRPARPAVRRNLIPRPRGENRPGRRLAFESEPLSESSPVSLGRHLLPRPPAAGRRDLTSLLDTFKVIIGKRWPLIALLFALELAMIVLVSTSSIHPSEMTVYEKQYNSTSAVLNQTATAQTASIFRNNFRVAMFELVPLLGLAIFGLSLYETARIVQVIGIVHGQGVGIALGTLFILPSTWLELPAYAIAASESFYLVYAIGQSFRRGWRRTVKEMRYAIANVIMIALVLLVAAVFEVTEIQLERGPPQTQVYVFATWLPFMLVFLGFLTIWRRARKEAPAIEEREASEIEGEATAPADPGIVRGDDGTADSPSTPLGDRGEGLPGEEAPEHYPDQHHDRAREPHDHRSGDVGADAQRHHPVDHGPSY